MYTFPKSSKTKWQVDAKTTVTHLEIISIFQVLNEKPVEAFSSRHVCVGWEGFYFDKHHFGQVHYRWTAQLVVSNYINQLSRGKSIDFTLLKIAFHWSFRMTKRFDDEKKRTCFDRRSERNSLHRQCHLVMRGTHTVRRIRRRVVATWL